MSVEEDEKWEATKLKGNDVEFEYAKSDSSASPADFFNLEPDHSCNEYVNNNQEFETDALPVVPSVNIEIGTVMKFEHNANKSHNIDSDKKLLSESELNLYTVYKEQIDAVLNRNEDFISRISYNKTNTFSHYKFEAQPYEIYKAFKVFNADEDNSYFTRGCKWSPDGTCLMSNSNDNIIRIFDLPNELYEVQLSDHNSQKFTSDGIKELTCSAEIQEGELIYDFIWFPQMNSQNPISCCFATTSKDHPVHLWDAYSGELRCTYKGINHMEELIAAHSLCFDPSGNKLYCGYNKSIKIFDVANPGLPISSREFKVDSHPMQLGIISCITVNPAMLSVYAAGSYLRTVGLYCEPEGTLLCLLEGQMGGITHMLFSHDGLRLYSGGRKDSEIICWDIRNPGEILYVLHRDVVTNQRIYFDIDSTCHYLASGNSNGFIRIWNLNTQPVEDERGEKFIPPYADHELHRDCCNGVSLHPTLPIIITSAGQRHYPDPLLEDSDNEEIDSEGESHPKVHKIIEEEALASQPPYPLNMKVKVRPMTRKKYLEDKDYSIRMWWAGGGLHYWSKVNNDEIETESQDNPEII